VDWTTCGCHQRLCMLSFRSFGGICETASCPVRELTSPRDVQSRELAICKLAYPRVVQLPDLFAIFSCIVSRLTNRRLLLFCHAPLGVRSAVHRHQAPQRAVLSQVDCFVQCEVVGSQISPDSVQPRDTRMP